MRRFIIFLVGFLSFWSSAQVNTPSWGVEDTIIVISKTTDFGPVHDYIEVFNNSGQDLNMRWICHEPISWPALWITNFTDPPQNNYDDVQDLDSADFVLTNPVSFLNKFIIGVQHQSYAHIDTIVFEVWPLDYPQDRLFLHYVIQIDQGNAWALVDEPDFIQKMYVDKAHQLHLIGNFDQIELNLFALNGQHLLFHQDVSHSGECLVSLEGIKSGCYIVTIQSNGKMLKKRVIF